MTVTLRAAGPRVIRAFIRYVPPRSRGIQLAHLWHRHMPAPRHTLTSREASGLRLRCDLNDPLARILFYRGWFERRNDRFARWWLGPGDAYLDVGAYIGATISVAWEVVGQDGLVVGVEADARTFGKLAAAVADSGHGNVILHAVGIAGVRGFTRLEVAAHHDASCNSLVLDDAGTVPVVPLDALAGARHYRLVKVDVEGFEPLVIAGATKLLGERRADAVLIELNPAALERSGFAARDVAYPLEQHGYDCHLIAPDGSLAPGRFATDLAFEDFVWVARAGKTELRDA